jgi:uncharacterized protein (DUF1697 family)
MAELRAALTAAGFDDVRTYIQSGNVVVDGGPTDRDEVSTVIAAAIADRWGFDLPVVVRDAADLPALLGRSAELFPAVEDRHDKLVHIGFLSALPEPAAVAALDPQRSPGDKAVVEAEHVHISYRSGAGSSKLTGDYLERTLGVAVTMRNLSTVRSLNDLIS